MKKWWALRLKLQGSFECSICHTTCSVKKSMVVGEHEDEDSTCDHPFCMDCLERMQWSSTCRLGCATWINIPCPWCRLCYYVPVTTRMSKETLIAAVEMQSRMLLKYDMIEEIMNTPIEMVDDDEVFE